MKLGLIETSILTTVFLSSGTSALAWGDEGHEVVAHIAYALLTPRAKSAVDALLADDPDTLTAPDFASRATWADKYRDAGGRHLHYEQTQKWHFVDMEISAPDLTTACFGFPQLSQGENASDGPANDCAANKIPEFAAELGNDSTPEPERIMALKFLMHFVGDLHQPLHASDDNDRGGNCEQVRLTDGGPKSPLHHYWDVPTVDALFASDQASNPNETLSDFADHLRLRITPAQMNEWSTLGPNPLNQTAQTWASESYQVAVKTGYNLPPHAACTKDMKAKDYPAFVLPTEYQTNAVMTVETQLEKAGVRLAAVLNAALN